MVIWSIVVGFIIFIAVVIFLIQSSLDKRANSTEVERLRMENNTMRNELLELEEKRKTLRLQLTESESIIDDMQDDLDRTRELWNGTIKDLENTQERLLRYINLTNAEKELENIRNEAEKLKTYTQNQKIKKEELLKEIKEKESQVIQLDEEILLQDFGLYEPMYDFATSDHYKERLAFIRLEQKNMILRGEAAICPKDWRMNGSLSEGKRMIQQNIKLIVRCFNDECDALISKVKFSNVNTYLEKIYKSRDALNKLNAHNAIELSEKYVDLKIEELKLAYEYEIKRQDEKEEAKRYREQLREEAKLLKEIEEARRDIEKEQKHYTNALVKLNKQLETASETDKDVLLEKKIEIENHLEKLDTSLKDIDYREANKKAGYVYIISNIGSFGEGIYKIGMTRRLDPYERVDELGDASVPFKFDVHAMIFSDDAPKLEAALHRAFENKKLNMVNHRREFFRCSLEEIEEVVKANYDKTVEFTRVAEAGQFRESEKMKFNKNKLL